MIENQLARTLSLNGEWQIEIGDQTGPIPVPGVWESRGYPLNVDAACYRREFVVPTEWADARVVLRFRAVSYFAEVLVNGQAVGYHEGLWTAFELDVTDAIHVGAINQIEVHVVKPSNQEDGQYPYRKALVGFIPYISTTFGGIWQGVELIAYHVAAWRDIHIMADWRTGQVVIRAALDGAVAGLTAQIEIRDANENVVSHEERAVTNPHEQRTELHVDHSQPWSPESPVLYEARLRLLRGTEVIAQATRRFGFRQLHTKGDQLLLNGKPVNLRGILAWGWDPATLAPMPTDQQIREEFRRVRDLGFNLYKLCLYVPTANVFEIADEEGMLLWLELPMWWQITDDHLRQQAPVEYADILAQVQHHPSVVIYSLGCELDASMADAALLETLNQVVRTAADHVLVCDNSGSGEAFAGLAYDLADFNDYHFYADLHDFAPLLDHFRRDWRPPRPWIFGEFCYSDDYRDPAQLVDAEGQRAWWRDLLGVGSGIERWAYRDQEERMAALDLPHTDAQLVELSRRKSFMIRKHTLETMRARRGMGGYVITGLRDTPISTSGLFDDHGQSKVDANRFRQFNAGPVLLLEQGRARRWVNADQPYPHDRFNHWSGTAVNFHIVLNYVGAPPAVSTLHWQLEPPDKSPLIQGDVPINSLPEPGVPGAIARLHLALPEVRQPEQWTLVVHLDDACANHWPLWLYPQPFGLPENTTCFDPPGMLVDFQSLPRHDFSKYNAGILITSVYTSEVRAFIEAGGQAILMQTGPGALPTVSRNFWGMTLVLLEDHPALARFPHAGYADLQFYHLAADYAFDMSQTEAALPEIRRTTPAVRGLDMRLFTAFDYLLELEIGRGRLLATTLRFSGGRGDQVKALEANIAGRYLLSELIRYLEQPRRMP